MKDVLGANACPVVIPIGAEESFKGLLIDQNEGYFRHDETDRVDYSVEEIPANLVTKLMNGEKKMLEKVR